MEQDKTMTRIAELEHQIAELPAVQTSRKN